MTFCHIFGLARSLSLSLGPIGQSGILMTMQNMENTEQPIKETLDNEAVEELNKEKAECSEKCDKLEKELAETRQNLKDMEAKLTEATDTLSKTQDSYVRLMAEFDNYRRRTAQEKLDLVTTAAEDTIKGLLVVLDDCERAIKVLTDSNDSPAAKEGTVLIYNKLIGYLKSKGLSPIEAQGCVFDTDVHEAVAQLPVTEEDKKGKVFDVVQTGYKLNGKVIRFAKVVVGI